MTVRFRTKIKTFLFVRYKISYSLDTTDFRYFSKDFYAELYVDCVKTCSGSSCSSDCAREFNENLTKEKAKTY